MSKRKIDKLNEEKKIEKIGRGSKREGIDYARERERNRGKDIKKES